MNNRYRISTLLLITFLATGVATGVWAQQPGQEPEAPEAEPPKPEMPEPKDPVVLAVLETNPSTPAQLARAARILADLGRPDLGKQFLRQVIDAKLNEQQLAQLAKRFGSPMFVNMAAREDLLPEAKLLADAVLAAANRQLEDPKRIATLIKQLQDRSPNVRYQALAGLKEARTAAVGPLVEVLADPSRATEHANVRAALARMRSDAIGPLLGILEASDPMLVAQAIQVLAQMDAKEATIYLLAPYSSETSNPVVRTAAGAALVRLAGRAPTRRRAVRLLTERAKAYFDRSQPVGVDAEGRVELWSWDEGKRLFASKSYPAEDAAHMMAARLARDAYALAKEDPEVRLLYLATMLEEEAYENGLDKPLPEGKGTAVAEAAGFGVGVIEDVMQHAIAGDHVGAATAAARLLGRMGTADDLLRQGARPAPLVRATRHPDRRLRMAAIDAIIRLQPIRPFPGSSYIPQASGFFAASSGVRRALVAGPSTETSRQLAGMLAGRGFDVDTAVTGRELIRLAGASPDYELALIDAAIEQPSVDLLLQQLRHDCRSATLRVGLVARSGYLKRAQQIARRDPIALAFSPPRSDESFEWQMEQLTALSPRAFVDHAERQRQAAEALERLAELSGPDNKLYDVRRVEDSVLAALYTPELSAKAVVVLGNLGTAESQRALVELASRWTQPLQLRRAAVTAFRRNTQENGILLTTDEILRQYDRYNQSEHLEVSTQRVLGLILDCIEAPTEPVKAKKDSGKGKPEGGRPKGEGGGWKAEGAKVK